MLGVPGAHLSPAGLRFWRARTQTLILELQEAPERAAQLPPDYARGRLPVCLNFLSCNSVMSSKANTVLGVLLDLWLVGLSFQKCVI